MVSSPSSPLSSSPPLYPPNSKPFFSLSLEKKPKNREKEKIKSNTKTQIP